MAKRAWNYRRAVVVDECEFNRIAVARLLRGPLGFESVTELASLDAVLRSAPDDSVEAVVFNLDPARPADRRVEEVKYCYPGAVRILIASEKDPKAIQARLFAGVDGYIPLQLSPAAFRSALRNLLSEASSCPPSPAGRNHLARSRGPQHAVPLTPRQREIVMHLAQGRTSREIGMELGLPSGTVRSHLHAIYKRTGVRHRIAMMRALGPINPSDAVVPAMPLRGASRTL